MGRPRLYHTPEQKQAANRLKSRLSYQRHKSSIKGRRKKVNDTNIEHGGSSKATAVAESPEEHLKKRIARHLKFWVRKSESIANDYAALMATTPAMYIDAVLDAYWPRLDQNVINDAITKVTMLHLSSLRYEDKILNLAGVDIDFRNAAAITKEISGTIKFLEDVMCHAMVGSDGLRKAYDCKTLLYQVQL